MKWIFLVFGIVIIVPVAIWLRRNPAQIVRIWMLIGFLPFTLTASPYFDIAIISWPAWPGYAKGTEISVIDILALSIFLTLPRSRNPLPFKGVFALYFLSVAASVFQAQLPMASVFYIWQLVRMGLIFVIVAHACTDERVPLALLKGMAIGIIFQATVVVWQRFGLGILQAGGTFGHQNFLGMSAHFIVLPVFAILLAGQRGWVFLLAPVAGTTVAVLTTSRATLGLAVAGYLIVYVVSISREWTSQKAVVVLGAFCVAAALAPIAISSFERRFTIAPLSEDYGEREAFIRAASLMLDDHPMGVGANNYVVVANSDDYLDRAGVVPTSTSRATMVHNIYWLTAAELGYFGIFSLMLLLIRIITFSFLNGWRIRRDLRGDLLIGLSISIFIVCLHANYEWIFFMSEIQYIFAIMAGLIVGLTLQIKKGPSAQLSATKHSL